MRLLLSACLALTLALSALAAAAQPAWAGDDSTIDGFDRFDLGQELPAKGDEMYSRFTGPEAVEFGGRTLGQYQSNYTLELASGSFKALVTLGFGEGRKLEAIFLQFNNGGKGLSDEQASALAGEFRQVFLDKYQPAMLKLDSFPGGAQHDPQASGSDFKQVLLDSRRHSIWLSRKAGSVIIVYVTDPLTTTLYDSTFKAESKPAG